MFEVTWGTLKESQIQWLSRVGRPRAGIVRLSWFMANKSINIQKAFETETFPDDKRVRRKELHNYDCICHTTGIDRAD